MAQGATARVSGPIEYLPAIDGLRGIAVLLVLFNHVTLLLGASSPGMQAFWRHGEGGWIGVDLFFVVSGFLITRLLLQARGRAQALRVFWLRRGLRIFPLAYLYLSVVVTLTALHAFPQMEGARAFGWASLYLTNFYIALHGWAITSISVLWSLAIEEHFYMLWPLAALYLSPVALRKILFAIVLLTPAVRAISHVALGPVPTCVLTWCRWDALAFGAALAMLWASPLRDKSLAVARRLLLPSLIFPALAVLVPFGSGENPNGVLFDALGYSALALSFTIWAANAIAPGVWVSRVLNFAPLSYLGKLCYGMYIWHVLCGHAISALGPKLGWQLSLEAKVALWFALTLAIATLSYRLFEAPINALKQRVSQPASTPIAHEAGAALSTSD